MRMKMVGQRRSTGNVKKQAVQQRALCALQVLLKDVPRMAIPPDGITSPVGSISVMNALTITTEAIRMDMTNILHGKRYGLAMEKLNLVPKLSWQTSSSPIGSSVQNLIVENGGNLPRKSSLLHR